MEEKLNISICLGSACFARGNNHTRKVIEDQIREHGLNGKVGYQGARCFGHCQNGPVLKLNEEFYEEVSENSVIEILDKAFLDIE